MQSLKTSETAALELPEDSRVMVSIHYYFGTAHSGEFLDCAEEWSLSDKKEMYKTFRLIDRDNLKDYVDAVI